jgi:hypothetical protein
MGILLAGAEFFNADGGERTDRHDEANSCSSQLCEKHLINGIGLCINLSRRSHLEHLNASRTLKHVYIHSVIR